MTNASFVAEVGSPVVELLAPRAGERILDLGCGEGARRADEVIARVRRALRPGGRFVGEFRRPQERGRDQARVRAGRWSTS